MVKRWPVIWPFFPSVILAGVTMITLGPLLNQLLLDVHAPRSLGGLPSLGYFFGMCLAIVAINFALGGLSSRASLMTGAGCVMLGDFLAGAVAHRLAPLAAAFAVVGAGYGFLNIVPGLYISSADKQNAGRNLTIVNALFAFGVVVTPPTIGRLLAADVGWRTIVLGEAVLAAALFVLFALAPAPDVPGRRNLRWREVVEVRRTNPRLWRLILLLMMLYVGAEGVFNIWLAKFQTDRFGVDETAAGWAVTIFWIGITAGRFSALRIMRRLTTRQIVEFFGMAMAAAVLLTALSPNHKISLAGCLLTGFAAGPIFPLLASYTARFPSWLSGSVYSTGYLAACVGNMALPLLVGPAADSFGFRAAMCLAAVPAVALVLLTRPLERAAGSSPSPT
jgi:fucose permease